MYALVNCDIYTGQQVVFDKALLINGPKILDLVTYDQIPVDVERLDLKGQSLAPGFIDIQVNGGGGVLFNDSPTVETIRTIVAAHRKFGTTDLLPTFITADKAKMREAINAVQECIDKQEPGVRGIHLEGPFIEGSKAGVHEIKHVRSAEQDDIDLVSALQAPVTLLTLAPETVSSDLIVELVRRGVRVSAGHTAADYVQMEKAFDSGVSCVTHLFNAMTAFTGREPGVVGASLSNDKSWCGIIVDGYHVHFSSVRVAWHAKQKRKMILVTDAMPPVGSPMTHFRLGAYDIEVHEGRCTTPDGVLAGSALDMATAVRNCVQQVGIPKDEALRMASTYPAEYIGLEKMLGRIAPGYQANLTIFNNQIHVSAVIVNGEYIAA